ncbi:hypothetical protein [Vibrio renipiscarius]|uniref:hypothetical protein n=1 Tax=Vibrio renipiscarius TaxID=1461322 RepID=UPI000A600879|nr:hypothetical protein [Vibrio renipiscarius]
MLYSLQVAMVYRVSFLLNFWRDQWQNLAIDRDIKTELKLMLNSVIAIKWQDEKDGD